MAEEIVLGLEFGGGNLASLVLGDPDLPVLVRAIAAVEHLELGITSSEEAVHARMVDKWDAYAVDLSSLVHELRVREE